MSIVGNWITNTNLTSIYTCSGTIDDNVIEASGGVGIWVSGLGVNNASTEVTGNWIENAAGIGIVLSNGVLGVLVADNECQDVSTACIAEIDGAGDVGSNVLLNNHSSNLAGGPGAGFRAGPAEWAPAGCPGYSSAFSFCANNIADAVAAVKPDRPWFPSLVASAVPTLGRGGLLLSAALLFAIFGRCGAGRISRPHRPRAPRTRGAGRGRDALSRKRRRG
jgi:hypothetical protein